MLAEVASCAAHSHRRGQRHHLLLVLVLVLLEGSCTHLAAAARTTPSGDASHNSRLGAWDHALSISVPAAAGFSQHSPLLGFQHSRSLVQDDDPDPLNCTQIPNCMRGRCRNARKADGSTRLECVFCLEGYRPRSDGTACGEWKQGAGGKLYTKQGMTEQQ